jgi:hypothetical protein
MIEYHPTGNVTAHPRFGDCLPLWRRALSAWSGAVGTGASERASKAHHRDTETQRNRTSAGRLSAKVISWFLLCLCGESFCLASRPRRPPCPTELSSYLEIRPGYCCGRLAQLRRLAQTVTRKWPAGLRSSWWRCGRSEPALSTQCGHSYRTSAPYKATIYEHLARFGIGAARGLPAASRCRECHRRWLSCMDGQSPGAIKVMAYRLYRRRSFWLRSEACTPSPLLAGQLSQRLP